MEQIGILLRVFQLQLIKNRPDERAIRAVHKLRSCLLYGQNSDFGSPVLLVLFFRTHHTFYALIYG